jgi:hypothetical protein
MTVGMACTGSGDNPTPGMALLRKETDDQATVSGPHPGATSAAPRRHDPVALSLSGVGTVRARVTNTSNSSMKSRKNCAVDLSVTAPTSVIKPGLNWM